MSSKPTYYLGKYLYYLAICQNSIDFKNTKLYM